MPSRLSSHMLIRQVKAEPWMTLCWICRVGSTFQHVPRGGRSMCVPVLRFLLLVLLVRLLLLFLCQPLMGHRGSPGAVTFVVAWVTFQCIPLFVFFSDAIQWLRVCQYECLRDSCVHVLIVNKSLLSLFSCCRVVSQSGKGQGRARVDSPVAWVSGVWCLSAWSRFHRTHRIRPPRPGWAGRRHTAAGEASIASLSSPPRSPPPPVPWFPAAFGRAPHGAGRRGGVGCLPPAHALHSAGTLAGLGR